MRPIALYGLALALLVAPAMSSAQETTGFSRKQQVSFRDLDLRTPAGVTKATQLIEQAVQKVCRPFPGSAASVEERSDFETCIRDARTRALAEFNHRRPAVTELTLAEAE